MARNGSGTYSNPYPNFVSGTVISSSEVDANNSDIATALTQSIAVDGQSVVTASIPLSANKLTGVAVGSASTDSLNLGQAQAEAFIWCGTASGSADAITLAPSPAITAYAAGQRFVWMAGGSVNTGATTVAISGLSAIALQDNGVALVAGNHAAGKMFMGILNTTSTVQIMQVQSSGTDPLIISSLTVDGNSQFNGTITVGVDGTGKDVKFFGDTASAYLLWDESADKLLTAGGALIDIVKDKLMIGGTAVTTTAAELNILDGVTSTTAELNILDGVTSTAAEINILDGVTSTAAELNYSDTGAAVGTVVASKVVTVDANKDVASFRDVTLAGIHASSGNQIDIEIAGADDFRFTANTFSVLSGSTLNVDSGATIANSGTATGFGVALANDGNNRVVTATGSGGLNGEANLGFDGTDLTVSTGSVIFGAAGKGVYLGVTTATAANLLDDYEEGTFTPTLTATTTNPTVSSGSLTGFYRKIGGTVFLYIKASVVLSNVGSGTIHIASLPFTSADTIDSYAGALAGRGLSVSGTTTSVVPFVQKQEAYLAFNLFDQDSYPGSESRLTHSNLSTDADGCNWYITVNYAV